MRTSKDVTAFGDGTTPRSIIHEMGTARMGRDPKTSLNAHNQEPVPGEYQGCVALETVGKTWAL